MPNGVHIETVASQGTQLQRAALVRADIKGELIIMVRRPDSKSQTSLLKVVDALYAANQNNNTIEKFTPGGVGSVFANTGLSGPNGLAFDSQGNLYAVNTLNSTIEKFTPGGVGSVFANSGFSSPTYIAIIIPEPSTWAMLALGIASLLGLRRQGCFNFR